jgi:hypothetical protein
MEIGEGHVKSKYLLAAALVPSGPVIDAAIAQQRVKRNYRQFNKEWEMAQATAQPSRSDHD